GLIVGTLAYMAPEQLDGHAIDHRADLYALGCVFYAMCAGRAPIEGDHTIAIMRRVIEGRVPALADFCPHLPTWLVAIIERLMARRPEDRYNSAAEVVQLLRQHRSDPSDPQVVELTPVGPLGFPPPPPSPSTGPATLIERGPDSARELPTIAGARATHSAATVQLAEPPIAQPPGSLFGAQFGPPSLRAGESFRDAGEVAGQRPLVVPRRSAAGQARQGRGTGRMSLLIAGGSALICVLLLGVAYGVWKATHGSAGVGGSQGGDVGQANLGTNGSVSSGTGPIGRNTGEAPTGRIASQELGTSDGDSGNGISAFAAQSAGVAPNGSKLPQFQPGVAGTGGGPGGPRPNGSGPSGGMPESEMRRMLDAGKYIEVQAPGVPARRFFMLGDAVANAPNGGELVLHGDHVWETQPLDIRGRGLSIRSAAPVAARIRFMHDAAFRGPMLQTDKSLSLEGLTLVDDASEDFNGGPPLMPNFAADGIISTFGAELKLDRCKIGTNRRAPCVWIDTAARVEIRNCQFSAERGTGIMWRDIQNPFKERRSVTIEQSFIRARVGMFLDVRHDSSFFISLTKLTCLADDVLHLELPSSGGVQPVRPSMCFESRQ
ncbi:MAG TPA: hypothetical protein PLV92_19585, partial [Pirellulaceae bacterium]|nr:hypothetical protein [Pirellulaceae bacterium]